MSILLLAASAIVPAGQTFVCTPTRVWDGDGPIWCAEGPKVRLSGIAARELDGACRPSHPCPGADPVEARDYLVTLLGVRRGTTREGHVVVSGPALQCRSAGGGGGNRTAAWCVSPTVGDLSCAMIKSGRAARWDRYWRGRDCPVR